MSANSVLLLIFAIYMIAFGFVGLKTGNKKVKERKKREENCTASTTAKIVGIKEEAYLFERHNRARLVYEYEVNGKIYSIPSSHSYTGYSGYYSNTKKAVDNLVGTEVEIRYNTENPAEFYSVNEPSSESMASINSKVNKMFIVIGCVILLFYVPKVISLIFK